MNQGAVSRLMALLLVFITMVLSAGCSSCRRSHEDDGTSPSSRELPKVDLRDDTQDLMLMWMDAKGNTSTAFRPADVPVESRDMVRVMFTNRDDGTRDLFYVADLRSRSADGTYPVSTMARAEWESMIERRRAITMGAAAPPSGTVARGDAAPSDTAPLSPSTSKLTAIVYGAQWCEPCHEAQRYLRRKGITVVYKDIDEDPGAREEMQKKLARAGLSDRGSIPVIDVRGRILLGFSTREIDKAIKETTRGDEL